LLTEASQMLSGMTRGAGLVIAAKQDSTIRHIEFIRLDPKRALVVLVGGNDQVENRIMELPDGVTAGQLTEAANFLNAHLAGPDAERGPQGAWSGSPTRCGPNSMRSRVIWSSAGWRPGPEASEGASAARLIVRGRGNLLEGLSALAKSLTACKHAV
jgi:heat-inducible transcriptional repressor